MWPLEQRRKERERRRVEKDDFIPSDETEIKESIQKAAEAAKAAEVAKAKNSGKAELRKDGPTVEQFVEAGYRAENYPPKGYASKSSKKDINAAIKAQEEADKAAVKTTSPFGDK